MSASNAPNIARPSASNADARVSPLPRYDAYKDSGVDWLGKIPEHWETIRLKFQSAFKGGGTPSKDNKEYWSGDIPWVSPKDMKADRITDTQDHITPEAVKESSTSLVEPGSVLIVVRSGILKHTIPVAINSVQVALNQDLKAMTPAEDLDSAFLAYLIRGKNDVLLLEWTNSGTTVESLEQDRIANTEVPVPPLPEQRAIAAYLDRETARIDALLDKKQRLIELLEEKRTALISHAVTKGLDDDAEMQDSGVEWLEKIPESWSTARLRFLLETSPSKTEVKDWDPETEVSFVPMESVGEGGGLDLSETKPLEDVVSGYTYFRNQDVLVAKITPCFENGKGALARDLENGVGFGTTELHVLRPGDNLDARFLFYTTMSHPFRKMGESTMYGAGGQKRVSDDFIQNLRWPIPPLAEQRAIATYLDRETARIDALVDKIRDGIARLKEYRTALVSAAVTGRIDVRGQV
ncbi:restriction endonuclease subunit S [Salisaeta longa]|uniref:restriction endonuclease subunit S n=1 Tax=Salisaeta longa TaxID=503170 RepID=UPI0003B5D9B2|nr:restriction endonuclease subunit S [Salisaeta longa]